MKLRKTEDVLLIIAFALIAGSLLLGIGALMWTGNIFSQVGSGAPSPPGRERTVISVILISVGIGAPMLIIGFLMLVVSVIVHFATRPKHPARS